MQEETVYKLMGQRKLKDKYKDQDVLPEIKYMVGMIQPTETYLRSCNGIKRASLTNVFRKIIRVQTHGICRVFNS